MMSMSDDIDSNFRMIDRMEEARNFVWITADHTPVKLGDIGPGHLNNLIKFLARRHARLKAAIEDRERGHDDLKMGAADPNSDIEDRYQAIDNAFKLALIERQRRQQEARVP
jgi:hypothetical protein